MTAFTYKATIAAGIIMTTDDALSDLHWRIRRFCREYPLDVEMGDLIVQWTREAYATGMVDELGRLAQTQREALSVTDSIDVPQGNA